MRKLMHMSTALFNVIVYINPANEWSASSHSCIASIYTTALHNTSHLKYIVYIEGMPIWHPIPTTTFILRHCNVWSHLLALVVSSDFSVCVASCGETTVLGCSFIPWLCRYFWAYWRGALRRGPSLLQTSHCQNLSADKNNMLLTIFTPQVICFDIALLTCSR